MPVKLQFAGGKKEMREPEPPAETTTSESFLLFYKGIVHK